MKIGTAWDTLKDADERRKYDLLYEQGKIQTNGRTRAQNMGEEAAKAARYNTNGDAEQYRTARRVSEWRSWKLGKDCEIFETKREITRIQVALKELSRARAAEEAIRERENSWGGYLSSFISAKQALSEEGKRRRDLDRLNRLHRETLQQKSLARAEEKLRRLDHEMRQKKAEYDEDVRKLEAERARKVREDELQARLAQMKVEREQAAKRVAEQKAKREEEARREELRREQQRIAEQERRSRLDEIFREMELKLAPERRSRVEETQRQAEQERRTRTEGTRRRGASGLPRAAAGASTSQSQSGHCRHQHSWKYTPGRQFCGHCHRITNKFAFQCPGCCITACAECRDLLRNAFRG
jgi:hypothetical protein